MDNRTSAERVNNLALNVLRLSRNTLLVNLRFLDIALSQFKLVPDGNSLATDGKHIFYDPVFVLKSYKEQKEKPVRDYLHMVLHCIFRHFFIDPCLDSTRWDLACDMAVENIINELNLNSTDVQRQQPQTEILDRVKAKVKQLTAEKIYAWLNEEAPTAVELEILAPCFQADDHSLWYTRVFEIQVELSGSSTNKSENENSAGCGGGSGKSLSAHEIEQTWKDISGRMQIDLDLFFKHRGDIPGDLTQNLRIVNREKYDYTAFLKKFAVLGETLKINDDEFDYIFYTYGLKLYDRMPLVEPLEYKEVKRIKEFVIAIDTSGSVAGELVQKFVQKTYNILKQEESFFTKINLHIIQCDAEIQEDAKITSQEEFDQFLKTMTLKGFGGTDFRPVFGYVNWLLEKKELTNLKGLIYFTDGYGVFPGKKPNYQTVFVFVDDEYNNNNLDVPPWAIKLMLQSNEL